MALGSLRELSIIATPPAKRSAIQTFVDEWDDETIQEACSRELHRGGQIFVLHNDIDTIDNMAELLSELMPNLNVRIAHGQMPSKELERIMTEGGPAIKPRKNRTKVTATATKLTPTTQ